VEQALLLISRRLPRGDVVVPVNDLLCCTSGSVLSSRQAFYMKINEVFMLNRNMCIEGNKIIYNEKVIKRSPPPPSLRF